MADVSEFTDAHHWEAKTEADFCFLFGGEWGPEIFRRRNEPLGEIVVDSVDEETNTIWLKQK